MSSSFGRNKEGFKGNTSTMDGFQSLDLLFALRAIAAAIGGLAVGFFGNMVGVGGGRPRLLLVYWVADNPVNAAGTNLLVGVLAGTIGTWRHLQEGRVDFALLLYMGTPSVIGAFVGGFFGGLVPRALLLVAVGIVTTWYGYILFTGSGTARDSAPPSGEGSSLATNPLTLKQPIRRPLLEMSFGLAIGLFGGAVGLVGGQLRLSAMTGLLGTDLRMAVGTTRAIGTLTAFFGFLGHLLHLEIDWVVLLILAPMTMVGAYFGARQTGKMSLRTLRHWVGGMMLITSLPIFWLAYQQL